MTTSFPDLVLFKGRHKDIRMAVKPRSGLACDSLSSHKAAEVYKKIQDVAAVPVHGDGGAPGVPTFILIDDDRPGFLDLATIMVTRCVSPPRHVVLLKMDRVNKLFEIMKRAVSFENEMHQRNNERGFVLRCLVVMSRSKGLDCYVLGSSEGTDDDLKSRVTHSQGCTVRVHFPPFSETISESRRETLGTRPPRGLVVARMSARPLPIKVWVGLRPDVILEYGHRKQGFAARLANQSWDANPLVRIAGSRWKFPEGASVAFGLIQDSEDPDGGEMTLRQPMTGGHSGVSMDGLNWWLAVDTPLTFHHKRKRATVFYKAISLLQKSLKNYPAPILGVDKGHLPFFD